MDLTQHDDILALIAKNLAGITNSVEDAQLNAWIKFSESNRQYFDQVRIIWDASDKQHDPNMINTQKALERVLSRMSGSSPGRKIWIYWQKVAAIIILPLLMGVLIWNYFNSQKVASANKPVYNEVFAAIGTRSSLRLADSTLVWLNSGSSLKYPDRFSDKTREVNLQGEAYFEVKSDVSRPFIVKTSNLLVKATGTKFNVMDFESNPMTEVTLLSGKVFVNGSNIKNSSLISELNPNQHLQYNKETGIKSILEEDAYKFIAWKDGKLIFRNEPLSDVVNKISLLYNVDIVLQGAQLNNYRYRATFHDESLGEILKLLKLSSPIDFKEVKREPLPDGSFPKKKVIIYPINQTLYN
jgi:transmembrane sensor